MQSIKGSRVLITGGTGFVGSHLVKRLVAEEAKVFVFDKKNSSTDLITDVLTNVELYKGDIADLKDALACMNIAQPDFIFNLAAMRKIDRDIGLLDLTISVNLSGTMNLFKAVQELNIPLRAFLQTGSLEEYGAGIAPYVESQRENPVSPYTASKVAATQFCQMLHRSLNYPVVVLRPCLVYGPGQAMDMFIPMLIDSCLKNKDFPMSPGEQTRDFIFVDDLVDAYLLAMNCQSALGEIINIGTGEEYKIKDIAKQIAELAKSKTQLQVGSLPKRVAEIERLVGDNSKAKTLLGWKAKTDLETGLVKTIQWYKNKQT